MNYSIVQIIQLLNIDSSNYSIVLITSFDLEQIKIWFNVIEVADNTTFNFSYHTLHFLQATQCQIKKLQKYLKTSVPQPPVWEVLYFQFEISTWLALKNSNFFCRHRKNMIEASY